MNEPRVIKKYPNRRLYDTVDSKYITLADIRRLDVFGDHMVAPCQECVGPGGLGQVDCAPG